MNKFAAKIDRLRTERGWTVYKLSQESGVPDQTISKWLYNNSMVTIPLLEQVCDAFGITLADFFAEGNLVEVTAEKKALHDEWCSLSSSEQAAVKAIMKSYSEKK